MKAVVFLLGFSILLFHNAIMPQEQMPRNVDEAIKFFEKQWTEKQKQDFKNKPETGAVTELHFSVGLWIRNNWIYGERDKALSEYFLKLGIHAPDDMSSIILISLHRRLNNKPIDLNEQVNAYKAAWKPVLECEKEVRKQAAATYQKYKIGDHIKILMHVDVMSDGEGNAVTFACPTIDWKFDPKKDMIIQGIISDKYTFGSDSNGFFKVRIERMNLSNTRILMDSVRIGQIKDFSLQNLVVKGFTTDAHK